MTKQTATAHIEKFIKDNGYAYTVSQVLKSYQDEWLKNRHTPFTMTRCIRNLEAEIKILLDK